MRGRKGLCSLFTSLPEHNEEKAAEKFTSDRRRRHSSGGDRETWSRKVEYIFAALGYAVGLGNIWRFPYLCYRNGGGAFLIPYILALITIGFPMLYLEMAFGQFASLGPITIWKICPLFKGIGYAIVVVLLLVNTYYNVLIAYSLYYLFASITSHLPWSKCGQDWNTDRCITGRCEEWELATYNASMGNGSKACQLYMQDKSQLKTPTEEYFERHLLNMTDGIHELGPVHWPLIVCLGVSWFTCFACLFKGIKSMGKAVIFTTLFSYLILTVLLIRGVTLPGSVDGIIFYLKPEFKKLGEIQVWGEAFSQAVASLSLGGGGWITLSSYNRFSTRCNRDAILVGLGNALTSIYSGFVIFSVLGYMAHLKGVPVDKVTSGGPGLAFVAYPEGLAMIPGAPFWAICFFFMMFTVGLDSLFGQVETIVAGIIDEYPEQLRPRRKLFTLVIIIFMFLMGIPLVTRGGMYIVTLMDWYTLLFSFSIISIFELIVIIYIYGYKRFSGDIEMMIGTRPNYYFIACWLVVTPLFLLCVVAFVAADYKPPYYGSYNFPGYAEQIGWALALCPVSLILIMMVIMFFYKLFRMATLKEFINDAGTRREVLQCLVNPTMDWGPSQPEDRRRYSSGDSGKRKHHSGDTNATLDDDVFGGAELKDMKPLEDKDRLVHFVDETKKDAGPEDKTEAEAGPEDGKANGQGETSAKKSEAEEEQEKLIHSQEVKA